MSSGDVDGSDPAASPGVGSPKRLAMVVGGVVAVVLALGIGGLTVVGEDRPEGADDTTAAERAAVELPLTAPDEPASDRPAGPTRRAETQPHRTDAAGDDAVVSPPGGTTAGTGTGQGGTIESGAGTGATGGTGSNPDTGSSGGDGPGTGDGGATTPTATPPPPTSDPTTKPTSRPTPKPTPSPSDEPTPEPTPSPTVSPSPEPTGAPMAQGTGR